ncbi:hypothetical protein ES703_125029 [subsurface metagenome]
MESRDKPKWQKEVEEILRKQYPEPEVSVMIGIANKLNGLADEVEVPSGDAGEVAAIMMKLASQELRPLAAVYLGFQLGAAYERLQNEDGA